MSVSDKRQTSNTKCEKEIIARERSGFRLREDFTPRDIAETVATLAHSVMDAAREISCPGIDAEELARIVHVRVGNDIKREREYKMNTVVGFGCFGENEELTEFEKREVEKFLKQQRETVEKENANAAAD